jgi:hypothetical protein
MYNFDAASIRESRVDLLVDQIKRDPNKIIDAIRDQLADSQDATDHLLAALVISGPTPSLCERLHRHALGMIRRYAEACTPEVDDSECEMIERLTRHEARYEASR